MKKVLILTRTNWNEPPRIRHQITRLLKSKGFHIVYIEKNAYKNALIRHRHEEGIEFYAHAELIHHQLRYFPIIQAANNLVVKFYLRKILKKIEFDFIFNFCYEYSFLKDLAPGKKIITMIEDDFESQAKFGMSGAIRNQVRKTCEHSDHVLTVSYPLIKKITQYTPDVSMLFPWSQKKYSPPPPDKKRSTVLYFGFIHRMDWIITERLVRETNYHFRFVGPTGKSKDVEMVERLKKSCPNFEYIPFSTLGDLRLDDVFCSIVPLDPTIKSVQATTINNRGFNMLSLGLPLVYADLPALIEAPKTVIRGNRTTEDYKTSLKFFKDNFYSVQPDIESFLGNHYEDNRWQILKTIISESPINKALPQTQVTVNKRKAG